MKTEPLHVKRKKMSTHLSPELRKKYNKRSIGIRKGDKVKIMRGEFKGKTAKVEKVSVVKQKVYLEGIKRRKIDGKEVPIPFHASNLMIIELDTSDAWRSKIIKRVEKNGTS